MAERSTNTAPCFQHLNLQQIPKMRVKSWWDTFSRLHTCIEGAIWDEESSHSYANQNQEFEEPETEKEKEKLLQVCSEQGFNLNVKQCL